MMGQLGRIVEEIHVDFSRDQLNDDMLKITQLNSKTLELSTKVRSAKTELEKARANLDREKKARHNLKRDKKDAKKLERLFDSAFSGIEFYDWMVSDLEQLFADEWRVTQDFCRLLTRLYEEETGNTNGASFLNTTSLGGPYERFNAPHRLALDMERLEAAYFRAMLDQASQSTRVSFALNELPAMGSDISARQALLQNGEVYFELTDEMFDAFYPGQYDRRIQALRICFPGLAKAGLSPHARLTQISNTRYLTHERNRNRGAQVRENRYPLQSIVLGAAEVDTATFDRPEGSLNRFQNTGVSSRWHLTIPTLQELKRRGSGGGRNQIWRETATRHLDALETHLDDVTFEVAFSGRW
ncbi:MAG: toxin complex protein, partial [Pseudomonadota bacterium]